MSHPSSPSIASPPRASHVAATIAANATAAILFTLISKATLRTISLPITALFIQSLVSLSLLVLYSHWTRSSATQIELFKPLKVWKAFLPLGLTRIVGALSKTACLANVDAAFYQTARGLLLPFTVILSLYFLPQTRFAPLTILGITLVIIGFFGGIIFDLQQALTLNWGVALGVWSSFTTAVETVVLKHYSAGTDLHMFQLLYMSAALSVVGYAPSMYLFEGEGLTKQSEAKVHEFLMFAMATGLVALVLSIATWLQVKITSPVTHTVVAATRGVLQSVLAAVMFVEPIPIHRWFSTIFILGGTGIYTWSKSTEKFDYQALGDSTSSNKLGGGNDLDEMKEVVSHKFDNKEKF